MKYWRASAAARRRRRMPASPASGRRYSARPIAMAKIRMRHCTANSPKEPPGKATNKPPKLTQKRPLPSGR
ncbi:unnamed protein product [Spirodela intermedia]|uniref:Uncharacterized protein n=1 Tax=Spirodela intermedia TaxID=51605 RepID=A0A7I8KNZ3_SPIIN|nr:unnamed protein product [Spirodela intermedia]